MGEPLDLPRAVDRCRGSGVRLCRQHNWLAERRRDVLSLPIPLNSEP